MSLGNHHHMPRPVRFDSASATRNGRDRPRSTGTVSNSEPVTRDNRSNPTGIGALAMPGGTSNFIVRRLALAAIWSLTRALSRHAAYAANPREVIDPRDTVLSSISSIVVVRNLKAGSESPEHLAGLESAVAGNPIKISG